VPAHVPAIAGKAVTRHRARTGQEKKTEPSEIGRCQFELTDEETRALLNLLVDAMEGDRYPIG
jgi:hypothetical protein